uniref:Uncharacterized protein n=1 Tax=Ditylenchus dipsaci TaxID=166011 RepID=A0A915CUF2_9BILA
MMVENLWHNSVPQTTRLSGLCNLVPYKKALPVDYRNFASLAGVRKKGSATMEVLGFAHTTRNLNGNQSIQYTFIVLFPQLPPDDSNSVMEKYGHNSRCFDFGPLSWTEKKCGRVKTYSQFMAGCYEFLCAHGRIHLRVMIALLVSILAITLAS